MPGRHDDRRGASLGAAALPDGGRRDRRPAARRPRAAEGRAGAALSTATEIVPEGYLCRDGLGRKVWTENPPNWHVQAWPLRHPWKADKEHGPTFNARVNGKRYWARYGASDARATGSATGRAAGTVDLHAGGAPRHHQAAGDGGAGARRRRTAALARGDAASCCASSRPTIRATARPAMPTNGRCRPAAMACASPRRALVAHAAAHRRHGRRSPCRSALQGRMGAEPARRLAADRRAADAGGGGRARRRRAMQVARAAAAAGSRRGSRELLRGRRRPGQRLGEDQQRGATTRPIAASSSRCCRCRRATGRAGTSRTTCCSGTSSATCCRRRRRTISRPTGSAWLQPDLPTDAFVHPQSPDAIDYWKRNHDWRGRASFFRDGYNYAVSTQNFNHTAAMGALLGGAMIDADNAIADGRHGLETLLLRFWAFLDGSTQEMLDHYYLSITLSGQKMFADFAPDADRPADGPHPGRPHHGDADHASTIRGCAASSPRRGARGSRACWSSRTASTARCTPSRRTAR